MAWKDSGDAVMYPDGSLVKGPKALCELQGYVYNAWVRMAEVFDALGKPERAQELRAKAAVLFERFNQAFWDEELGFYAYALDGDKKSPDHRIECRALPMVRYRAPRTREEGGGPADGARHVDRMGHPH